MLIIVYIRVILKTEQDINAIRTEAMHFHLFLFPKYLVQVPIYNR